MKRFGTVPRAGIILPLLFFVLAHFAAMYVAVLGNCKEGLSEICWVRWDSGLYLDIAKNGHTLIPCADNPDSWCGNAGWAPLYPLFISFLSSAGFSPGMAALFLSKLFLLLYLLVSAKLWQINDYSPKNWLYMGICAFAPGAIYFHAVFPLSMAVFFMALTHLYLGKEAWLKAGIAAFSGILSYSIGFFLLISLGLAALFLWRENREKAIKMALLSVLPAAAALIVWFTYDYILTGHWNAMFLIQTKYGHGLNSPLKFLGLHLSRLFTNPFTLKTWIEIQNMLVLLMVLLLSLPAILKKVLFFEKFKGLYLFFFWMLPFSASADVALYRNCAMLGPSMTLLKNRNIYWLVTVFILCIILWFPLGILFIKSILV